MHNNYILSTSNDFIAVNNIPGVAPTTTLSGLPLGTSDGSATGELAVKVISIGAQTPGSDTVQGFDNVGSAPSHNPFVQAFVDTDNNVQYVASIAPLPVTFTSSAASIMVSSGAEGFEDGSSISTATLPIVTARFGTYSGPSSPVLVVDRTPQLIKSGSANASGATTVWTPTSGTKFRLMKFALFITANATITAGATITVSLFDASTTILSLPIFVPATAVAILGDANLTGWLDLGSYGYLSTTADNLFRLNLSAALTTGSIAIICMGNEE